MYKIYRRRMFASLKSWADLLRSKAKASKKGAKKKVKGVAPGTPPIGRNRWSDPEGDL